MATPINITDTELAGNLKNVYTDYRNMLFPISTPTMAQLKKQKKGGSMGLKWGGNGVFFDVVVDRPVNAQFSGGYLGESSQAREVQGSSGVKRLYVTRAFDNLAQVGTSSKEAAFVTLKSKLSQEIDSAMQLGLEEALNGNGLGIKAIISSSADTTHFVATSPWGVANSGQGGLFLDVGQYIAVLDTTGVTVRGRAFITGVSNSGDNVTVTLGAAISGMTSTDIVVSATASDTGYNQSCNGLQNLLNVGGSYTSLHGVSASTYPRTDTLRFTAGTDTDSATDPNDIDIWTLATKLGTRSGFRPLTSPKDFFLQSTYGLQKKFIQSYLAGTQVTVKNGEKIDIDGGYKADVIHGIPFIPNEWSPAGKVFLVHKPSIAWFDAADWSAVEYEGSGAVRWISGRDAFETSYKAYFNVITPRRNAHAVIDGYTDTERYSPVV